eukprot:989610-Heterocapsa_arctica.AAC.1
MVDVAGQTGNGSFQTSLGPGHMLVAAIGAGGQVSIRGAAEKALIVVMSPAWLVIANPKKVTPIARDGEYSLNLHISIQQACDMVAILDPSDRVKCKFSAA